MLVRIDPRARHLFPRDATAVVLVSDDYYLVHHR